MNWYLVLRVVDLCFWSFVLVWALRVRAERKRPDPDGWFRGERAPDGHDRSWQPWVHPQANVYGVVLLGQGCRIAAFAEVGNAELGPGCKVAPGASIAPDCRLGAGVFVGPGARLVNDRRPRADGEWVSQGVTVGDGASIGANAVVLAGVTIGANAVIAAGAVVRKDVPAGATVFPVPVRMVRRLPPGFGKAAG